jgi:pimeloyl-ACP methyl ester carboxylesterase
VTTLVLLHAFPLDSRMYDALRARLPESLDLHTPDFAGFGGRPLPDAAPSLDVFADEVAAWLATLEVSGPLVLGGTSMGGYVTMALLRRHPDLADALLLMDTKASSDDDAARTGRLAMADRLDAEGTTDVLFEAFYPRLTGVTTKTSRPEVADQVRRWVQSAAPASAAWAQRAMAQRPASFDTLRDCGRPGLVVVGEEDELSPPADADAMARDWAGGQVVTIAEAGHLAAVERPEGVAQVVTDFLATLEA